MLTVMNIFVGFALTVFALAGVAVAAGEVFLRQQTSKLESLAVKVRPRWAIGDDFDSLEDDPTEEVPLKGAHPHGICPPLLVTPGIPQVNAAHLRQPFRSQT